MFMFVGHKSLESYYDWKMFLYQLWMHVIMWHKMWMLVMKWWYAISFYEDFFPRISILIIFCCSECVVWQNSDPSDVIYTSGCIEQGEVWVNQNLIPVAGVFVGLALVQVCHTAVCHTAVYLHLFIALVLTLLSTRGVHGMAMSPASVSTQVGLCIFLRVQMWDGPENVSHIVNEWPLSMFSGGDMQRLHRAGDEAINNLSLIHISEPTRPY